MEGSDQLVLSVRIAVKNISARVLDYFTAGHFCKPSNSSGIPSAEKFQHFNGTNLMFGVKPWIS